MSNKTSLGFWIYLMTDCVLFAALFATYAVLHGNTFGGPGSKELFELPFVLGETVVLLTSSFVCGLALLAAKRNNATQAALLLVVTLALGAVFLGLELYEFTNLVSDGNSWERSGFLSAFFTLVGTHGLHIAFGLLWGVVLLARIFSRGLDVISRRRLVLFSMFWHFLDVVWICIFTFVYLMGAA